MNTCVRERQTLTLDAPVAPERNPMRDPANRLKLAVFCANVARGTSMSDAETLPKVTWEESQRIALAADRAGIDGMIPLGRWKATARGLPPEVDRTFEPWTWASALSALTERISVFTTVNMQQYNPLIAALMTSTIDHVSGGRFSLNVVAGFNEQEFRMLGMEVPSHEDRYAHAAEWMTVVRRAWSDPEPFDFDGDHLHLHEVVSEPKPLQQPAPPIMSAGRARSAAGSPAATPTSTSCTSRASRRCPRSSPLRSATRSRTPGATSRSTPAPTSSWTTRSRPPGGATTTSRASASTRRRRPG
jgi:hypothetical protein